MKIKKLIKKIALEFDEEEIKVSEYFENIFEALTGAFVKNKNVNISEFGKFKIKAKLNEEGEKEKTITFSPVKKFAEDVNYNFSELSPVQVRVLDEKSLTGETYSSTYLDDECEDVILIDFEDEKIQDEEISQEIEVTEIKEEKVQYELLIPEETELEIVISEEEKVKTPEEILIPEERKQEIPPDENIPDTISHEVTGSKLIEKTESTKNQEKVESIDIQRDRIIDELSKIIIPEIEFKELDEIIVIPENRTVDEKIISEVTAIIKEKETETKAEEIRQPEIKEKDNALPDFASFFEDGFKKEEVEQAGGESIPDENKEEVEEPKITEQDEIIPDFSAFFGDEFKKEEIEQPKEEPKPEKTTPVLETDEKKEVPEIKKTNLQLEAELLKMLDERRKILEEIKRLENTDTDDLIDISETKTEPSDEMPKLFDESTLDQTKQDIFIDEEGKALEDLFKNFTDKEKTIEEPVAGEELLKELEKEEESEKKKKEECPEKDEKITDKEEIENFILKESTEEKPYSYDNELENLENLLGSLYKGKNDEINLPEPKEVEPHLNNPEMKVFDRLLDEPVSEEGKPLQDSSIEEKNNNLKSFSELEKMFVSFKTEKTEEPEPGKKEEIVPAVKKTEAIKTYDDIFNLIEPNGKKKNGKPKEVIIEKPRKKIPPVFKILIPLGIIIVLIIISSILYERLVYKPSEETKKLPVTQFSDSAKIEGNDSVIYADTNKTSRPIEEDIVFEENDVLVKESEKGFYLQYGNYENQFELAKKIKELKDKNIYPSFDKDTTSGKSIYRLRIGPYKTLSEAKKIIPKL